jgi:photosystem II stability/assembly factor-like uncharacterized protein
VDFHYIACPAEGVFPTPGNPNTLLAASDAGLLRTTTGPTGTWNVVLSGQVTDFIIHPTNPNILYCCRQKMASIQGGVYKSTDAGQTWFPITPNELSDRFGNARVAICRDAPSNVAFVYEFNGQIDGGGKSTNDGSTWTMFPSLPAQRGEASHALAIAIRPTNPNEIYVAAQGLYRTTDGGANWEELRNAGRHDDHTQLYFSGVTGSDILWICNDGGVYRYPVTGTTSTSWNGNQSSGLRIAQIEDIDAWSGSFRVVGLQDDGAMASNSAGSGWKGFDCCDVRNVAITNAATPTFWTNTVGSTVRKYLFSGGSYDVGDPAGGLGRLFYDRFGDRVFSMRGNSIVSRPASATSPGPWTTEVSISRSIGFFAGSQLSIGTIFAWYADTLVVLQWNGSIWTVERTVKLNNTISCIYPSTERPGECWAGLSASVNSPKILHTTDKWQSWSDISGSMANQPRIWSIAVRPFNAREVFAAVDDGVYRTVDGGNTWARFQEGLPKVQCRRLKFINDWRTGGGQLFVGTFGHSMYETQINMPPTVYVDTRFAGDGTFENPYGSFNVGYTNVPNGGMLALRGDTYVVPSILNRRMTINAYESTVTLRSP